MKKYKELIIAAFIGGFISVFVFNFINKKVNVDNNFNVPIPTKNVSYTSGSAGGTDLTTASDKSIQSVVHVKTQTENYYQTYNVFDFMFGGGGTQTPYKQMGFGSGVIISNDGYIVTNNHVIRNSQKIEVVLNDKISYEAKLIGSDPNTDIALLKIDAKDLPFMTYGNSDEIKVGQWVIAVGNPFNLTSTVTAGIISAKARNLDLTSEKYSIDFFIQTDAAVNPGSSGGALVNTDGELIGINTQIATQTGAYIGYSFAIPSNIVKKVVTDLIEFGEVQKAYLGVSIEDLNSAKATQLKVNQTEGVYVNNVSEGGGASESGIKKGDIIIGIGEILIKDNSGLQEQLCKYRPGDKINVSIIRDGNQMQIPVTLKNVYGDTKIIKTETLNAFGASFKDLSNTDKQKLRIDYGVLISALSQGSLKNSGISENFVITKINRKPIDSAQEVVSLLNKNRGKIVHIEGVYPNGMYYYYSFIL